MSPNFSDVFAPPFLGPFFFFPSPPFLFPRVFNLVSMPTAAKAVFFQEKRVFGLHLSSRFSSEPEARSGPLSARWVPLKEKGEGASSPFFPFFFPFACTFQALGDKAER